MTKYSNLPLVSICVALTLARLWRRHKIQMTTLNNAHYIKECMNVSKIEAQKRRGLII